MSQQWRRATASFGAAVVVLTTLFCGAPGSQTKSGALYAQGAAIDVAPILRRIFSRDRAKKTPSSSAVKIRSELSDRSATIQLVDDPQMGAFLLVIFAEHRRELFVHSCRIILHDGTRRHPDVAGPARDRPAMPIGGEFAFVATDSVALDELLAGPSWTLELQGFEEKFVAHIDEKVINKLRKFRDKKMVAPSGGQP